MGIPSYYKKLCDTIPGLLRRENPLGVCQYMWIDFNCMIYHCLRRPGTEPYQGDDTRLAWEAQFIQRVCDYLEHVVKQCAPTKGVYVAVDGVVPMAKIRQQRLRRFKSHWVHSEEVRLGKSGTGPRWDTNAITPGTAFMEKLALALQEVAKRHPHWTISAADEPGEGEQKVMAAMRGLGASEVDGHVVYGLDADLILLSLLQEREGRRIALFREAIECGEVQYNEKNEEEYRYLSIPVLAGAIAGNLKGDARRRYLLDYCMAMSFLGNDFLPHGLSLNLRNDGHTHIRTMLREIGPNLIHETHGWTLESLRRCLGWIAKKEEYLLKKALSTKRRIQFQPADGTGNELAYNEWFKTPLRVFDEIALVQKWNENDTILRKDWTQIYQSRYLENIQKRCEEEYCRGLNWIFYYYTGRPVSFEWMYPWHLPPLWCRLLEEARSWKQMPAQNPIGEFIKPQEQLALVLPQQSWWLVRDAALRALPEANPALWPTEFRLCMAGKRAMWECEAMIPLFTPARLRFLLGLSR